MEMLNEKKLVVLGGDGIIASSIKEFDYRFNIDFFSRNSILNNFDLSNPSNFDYRKFSKNNIILFLSAISKPIICQTNKTESYKINVINTIEAIQNLLNTGATIIFASTDMVYGYTQKKIFYETDEKNPTCNYSEWKSFIEEFFFKYENFKIFRFSQCVNSTDSFSKYVKNCIIEDEDISIYKGFCRNIFDSNLLQNLMHAIVFKSIDFKILNIAGDENIDRIKFVTWISQIYPKITLLDYKSNDVDLISKISLSNNELKKFISEKKIEFDFNNWLKKINKT